MTFECAICCSEKADTERAILPCCEREEATVQICFSCIEVICQRSPDATKCPRCNSTCIEIEGNGESRTIVAAQPRIRCRLCCHNKLASDFNNPSRRVCSVCEVGQRNHFRYECQRCHGIQSIPHPMYRYQPSPTEAGGPTWACHVGCRDYTTWCIHPDDVDLVPADEVPASWAAAPQEQES